MHKILIVILIVQFTGAMVTRKRESANEEPTTLPTDLYKPLTPLKNKSTPTTGQIQPSSNFDNTQGEVYGSSSYTKNNDNYNKMIDEIGARYSIPSMPGHRNVFPGISQVPNALPSGYHVSVHSMPNMMSPPRPSHLGRFLNRDPFSGTDQDFDPFSNPVSNMNDNHYQVSSSHTFYNSDSMAAPITQNYHYDSRNGGSLNFK